MTTRENRLLVMRFGRCAKGPPRAHQCLRMLELCLWAFALPAPAIARANTPATQTRPAAFADALKLTDKEAVALSAVRDRVGQLDETAFKMLLSKAAEIAKIEHQDLRIIDRPAPVNLLRHPERYRGWPVRLTLRAHKVHRLVGSRDISASAYWPADRPLWQLGCVDPESGFPGDEPLVVFSPVEPTVLGEPDKTVGENERLYYARRDARVIVTGYFYKVWRQRDADGNVRNYPIIVAWRFDNPTAKNAIPQTKTAPERRIYVMIVVLLILLMGYLLARRFSRRRAGLKRSPEYQPMRFDIKMPEEDEPTESEDGAGPSVDPLLRRAAQEYQTKKEDPDDAPDRSS